MARRIVSVLVECDGRTYRVIDNLREFLHENKDRLVSETAIGAQVLSLARSLEVSDGTKS